MALQPYLRAAAIGTVSGLRTFTSPAGTLLGNKSRWVIPSLLLAAGELVSDKLPMTPSRVSFLPLLARAASGGWSGRAVAREFGGSPTVGAAIGATGAVGGAWLAYSARAYLTKKRGLPDVPIALLEDAIAILAARVVTKRARS